jgi:aminopeptidase N
MLQPGVSMSLAEFRKKQISKVEYELLFDIPREKNFPVKGNVKISFNQARAQYGVVLDFRGGKENIHQVIVNGNEYDYQYLNEHIIISSRHIIPGRNLIEVSFTSLDNALNRSEDFMYSLFVPDRASTAFPCFDQPDLKALFELTLVIPEQWDALSNGPLVNDQTTDGRRVLEFGSDKPISTYLFAFTAGKYQKITQEKQGRVINMFHRETDMKKLQYNIAAIFSQHFQALEWLEEYTGIEYPFSKFDIALIPGFQYSGMEHPGAIWYRDSRLLLDVPSSVSQQLQKASLIAHETAHMWFGNLVTMKWFDDVWLKEVFAGFMADKMVEPMFPNENHSLQFLMTHYPRAYAVDRSAGTHPVRQYLQNLNQAGTLYGSIIYNKAPIVFLQLEKIMGEENFQNAVMQYLQDYSYDNADWDQLVECFNRNSSENINLWSQAWVYGKGMPRISYYIDDHRNIKIKTETGNPSGPFPKQYVELLIKNNNNQQLYQVFVAGHEEILELDTEVDHNTIVIPKGSGLGYGYFILRNEEKEYLSANIQGIEDDNIRAAAILVLNEDFLNGNLQVTRFFETILSAIANEDNPIITSWLLDRIQTLYWSFLTHPQREQYSSRVSHLLWERLQVSDPGMKSAWLSAFSATALDEQAYEQMIGLFEGRIKPVGYSLSEDDNFKIVSSLCLRRHNSADELFEQLLAKTTNEDRKRRLQYLSGVLSVDENKREEFFEQLKDPSNRRPEPWALEGLAFFHHPLNKSQAIEFLPPTLELLQEIQVTGDIFFPLRWLEAALKNYNCPASRQMVDDYLAETADLSENLVLKVLQAADHISRIRKE